MSNEFELDVQLNSQGVQQGARQGAGALSMLRGRAGAASTAIRGLAGAFAVFAGAKGVGSAIKEAARFERTMSELRGQVGLSEDTISQIEDQTEAMAATTGQSTDSIAEGYKFAQSAGLYLAESQETVETATKAAAAGFGEQRDLVRTATTATNAWSSEVESGTQFLDEMTAAAQSMDIQVDGLSSAFRRNVNIASQLNLELDETLAGLGAVAGAAGDASRGGRLFSQVLNGLLSPTNEAEKAISSVFGSVDRLRDEISQEGLVPALVRLRSELESSGREMEDVFTSSRQLEGALALTANEGDRAQQIMNDMGDASGNVQDTFDNTDDDLREYNRAMQQFNQRKREMAEKIMPIATNQLEGFNIVLDRGFGLITDYLNAQNSVEQSLERIRGAAPGVADELDRVNNVIEQSATRQTDAWGFEMADADIDESRFDSIRTRFAALISGLNEDARSEFSDMFTDALESAQQDLSADQINNMLSQYWRVFRDRQADAVSEGVEQGAESLVRRESMPDIDFSDLAPDASQVSVDFDMLPDHEAVQRAAEMNDRFRTTEQIFQDINQVESLEQQGLIPDQVAAQQVREFGRELQRLSEAGILDQAELRGNLDDLEEEFGVTFGEVEEEGNAALGSLQQAVEGFGRNFSRETADVIVNGEKDWSEAGQRLGKSFMSSLIETMTQRMIAQPLLQGLMGEEFMAGTGPLGGLFGTIAGTADANAATGGEFSRGDRVLVGEEQPEIVEFGRTGSVTPMSDVSGGGGDNNVEVRVINKSDSEVETRSRREGDVDVQEIIIGTVNEDLNNGGPISRSIQGNFDVSRQGR